MSSKGKQQQIRDVFADVGSVGMRTLVSELRARGVYSDADLERFALTGMMSDARAALSARGAPGCVKGLRWAYPVPRSEVLDDESDDDAAIEGPQWKQLPLFEYDEMVLLLRKTSTEVMADHASLVTLRDFCLERFGRAPEIVEIMEPV